MGDEFSKSAIGKGLSLAAPIVKEKIGEIASDNANIAAIVHAAADVIPLKAALDVTLPEIASVASAAKNVNPIILQFL